MNVKFLRCINSHFLYPHLSRCYLLKQSMGKTYLRVHLAGGEMEQPLPSCSQGSTLGFTWWDWLCSSPGTQ